MNMLIMTQAHHQRKAEEDEKTYDLCLNTISKIITQLTLLYEYGVSRNHQIFFCTFLPVAKMHINRMAEIEKDEFPVIGYLATWEFKICRQHLIFNLF